MPLIMRPLRSSSMFQLRIPGFSDFFRSFTVFVDTPLTRPFFDDPEFAAFVGGMTPAGRLGRVEEIGAAVVYLASPASGIATGISLKLDGGWTAH